MTWTPDAVLERLIDAFKTIEVSTSRPGPVAAGGGTPMFVRDYNDRMMAGGAAQKRDEEAMKLAQERRPVASFSISMAAEAQRWPIDIIQNEDMRECLIEYATCRARDGDWGKVVNRRNRRAAGKKVWVRRTTYRWNEKSLQCIADHLTNSGVLLRLADDGQVSHETAESPCELANVGLHAWRAPDAKPRHIPEMITPPSRPYRSQQAARR